MLDFITFSPTYRYFLTVQYHGGHDGAMFGECTGLSFCKFKPNKVVTICDHLCFFPFSQTKYEVVREAVRIAFYGLIKSFCRHAIQGREIGINDYLMLTYR